MHPIHKKHFGPAAGKLAVKFYDGSAVVTGFIVKQVGTSRFIVSNMSGTVVKTCVLAQTADDITALTAGTGPQTANRALLCTIEVAVFGGATENAKKVLQNQMLTVQGHQVSFKRGVAGTVAGQGTIAVVANVAPTVANAIPNQTGTVAAAFTYTVPANTFADLNADPITMTATKGDGTALPTGVTFDGPSRTFSKAAGAGTAAATTIKVTGSDGTASVSTTFTLTLS